LSQPFDHVRGWSGWSPLDRQLANLLLREGHCDSAALWITVALLTWAARHGDVCIDLEKLADRALSDVLSDRGRDEQTSELPSLRLPTRSGWHALLDESKLAGGAGSRCPLVLDGDRLYLARYYRHEVELAARVSERLSPVRTEFRPEQVRPLLARWFDGTSGRVKQAAAIAVARRLCVIIGGPGTGKTSTVVRLLGLLTEIERTAARRAPRVLLLAPTGKAAARLSESIAQAQGRLSTWSSAAVKLPIRTSTVHSAVASRRRLLGGSKAPFSADTVVLDEASMVDVAMMRRLLDAAVNVERLIVLGDPQQLASVEAGAVLGELCATSSSGYVPMIADVVEQLSGVPTEVRPSETPLISDHIVELTQSHRFREDGGIGLLARCIKIGDVLGAMAVLDAEDPEVGFVELPRTDIADVEGLIVRGSKSLWMAGNASDALAELERFRVLCAHRKGRYGVETWNQRIGRLASQVQSQGRLRVEVEPILVMQNAPDASLHNGDLGIIWREPEATRAFFGLADGKTIGFGLSRLPRHEPAHVMSIHKCQGSEVDEVVVLLPDADSPLLSRELLYTAVTRARKRCTLVGTREAVQLAVARRLERRSGLAAALARATHERATGFGDSREE
jgi:exodeoxyribonuclease V alpha subunit